MNLGLALGGVMTAALVIGVLLLALMYVSYRRQQPLPAGAVASAGLTLALLLVAGLATQSVVPGLSADTALWIEVAGYFCGAWFILLAIDALVVGEYLIERQGQTIPDLVRSLLFGAALIMAGLVILRVVANIDVVALVALPTIATAVVGVALKDTLTRLFAGIELGKSVKPGDWIRASGNEGVVTEIGLEHLTMLTRERTQVTLPNDGLIREGVVNFSRPTTTHLSVVEVEASYAAPPAQVCRVLEEAARAVDGVLAEPLPLAQVVAFQDSGILYRVKFPISDFARAPIIASMVRTYIWNAFARHKIEFPFPQRVIHTKPAAGAQEDGEDRDRIMQLLYGVDFLAELAPKQLEVLARESRIEHYLPGERVVRQGDEGQECYVIVEGTANVSLEEAGLRSTLSSVQEGQFFGELSLLTGERRAATVTAATPLKVIVIGKTALLHVVQSDQGLVERISEVVARRQAAASAAREQLSREASMAKMTSQTRSLIARIQYYLWGKRLPPPA